MNPLSFAQICVKRTMFLVLFFLILAADYVCAQESFQGFLVNPKVGIYHHNSNEGGFSVGLEFAQIRDKTIYSIDFYTFQEFTLQDPIPNEQFFQVGFMLGKFAGNKFFRMEFQGGVASVFGKSFSESLQGEPGTSSYRYYQEEPFFTIGLAGKLGFKFIPVKYLGLGFDLQTNLNLKKSIFFPSMSLEIGKLRN